jgi:uncharacterized membrane protein YesL
MGIFSPEGSLYKFISRFWDMVVLNFLWFLFSLPIITIGASTVAVFSVTFSMVDDEEGYVARSFVKAFRNNLKQGIILGLIAVAAGYMVYLNFALFNVIESNPFPLLLIGIIAGIYFSISLLYAFPLAARYQNTVMNILNNSRRICIRFFIRTLVLLVLIALIVLIILWNSTTVYFGLLIGPAFIIFLISSFSKRIFQKLEKEQD